MYKRGLKLWSVNTDYYLPEALKLYAAGSTFPSFGGVSAKQTGWFNPSFGGVSAKQTGRFNPSFGGVPKAGWFDYIELYVVPGSLDTLEKWKEMQLFPSFGGVAAKQTGWFNPSNGGAAVKQTGWFNPSNGGAAMKQAGRPGEIPLQWRGVCEADGAVRNTKNYMKLPYNPALKERAKELRKAGNLSEVLLWNEIKNKKLNGLDFDRQKIIGNYIVDFYCAEKNIVIEIDGCTHDYKEEYDIKRNKYLQGLGLSVIHLADRDVRNNLEGVVKYLYNHPALTGTPPKEGNLSPALTGTPPKEGNLSPALTGTPPKEGNLSPALTGTPPKEGNYIIPFIIHNAHFAQGFNLAKREKEKSNIEIYKETKQFADELGAEYIIFHGGIDGTIEETARQLKAFNEPRALIENKPYIALPNRMGGEFCRGYNTDEIQTVMNEAQCGFCFDFGHAVCAANSLINIKNKNKEDVMLNSFQHLSSRTDIFQSGKIPKQVRDDNIEYLYQYCSDFLKLNPSMYHLTDVNDILSPYDSHPHLGAGQLDFKRIFEMIPDNSLVTFETNKNSKENLDDFIEDMKWLQMNLS